MEVKVVVGANLGDESKGLVSGCLAREAIENQGRKVLTVLFNGTSQRAHTYQNKIYRLEGTGAAHGADTFYHRAFVVDPIVLWLTKTTPIIDPRCRVIFPCDVLFGQSREKQVKHGSCGCGLFAAVKRNVEETFYVADMFLESFYKLAQRVDSYYKYEPNEIHNLPNFIRAVAWLKENCRVDLFKNVVEEYDTIIYEGGQGLLLDQANVGDFPHLTPSSTGAYNIHKDIEELGVRADLFYVSSSYMTRHGNGPMDDEVTKNEINPAIIDLTNQPNEWQGTLRYGRIDMKKLYKRIKGDAARYDCDKTINMVFTHLNYTNNELETTEGRIAIAKPQFLNNLYVSDKKDYMEIMKQGITLLLFIDFFLKLMYNRYRKRGNAEFHS